MELHTASGEPQGNVHGVYKTSWGAMLLRPLVVEMQSRNGRTFCPGDGPWLSLAASQTTASFSQQTTYYFPVDVIFLNLIQSMIHLSVHT